MESKLVETSAIVKSALKNAKDAEAIAKRIKAQLADAAEQRDRYRAQRDLARTERDRLAGELASDSTKLRMIEVENKELIVKTSILEVEIESLSRSRWWWLAGGIAVGVGATVGAIAAAGAL